MKLYVGRWVRKVLSGRGAQVAGLDAAYVWLTWDDDGSQTRVRRERFGRSGEWTDGTPR